MDWLKEDSNELSESSLPCWKIVIVDDDEEIHKVTKLSLSSFQFEGRGLEFVSLYSGIEAKEYFKKNNDIALTLLDVVMESDDAGLQVANYLRQDLKNTYTRIILRTGQPGKAPESSIFEKYDIDGYKAKTDLSFNALKQVLYIALRAYRDLAKTQQYQKNLETIIYSIAKINQIENFSDLSSGISTQLNSIFNSENTHFTLAASQGYSSESKEKKWNIIINNSDDTFIDNSSLQVTESKFDKLFQRIMAAKHHIFEDGMYGYYFCSIQGTQSVFVLESAENISSTTKRLLELFVHNLVITIEKLSEPKQDLQTNFIQNKGEYYE